MADQPVSCTQSARGPLAAQAAPQAAGFAELLKEVPQMFARVGKPAPDFEAMAYHQGSFKLVTLSELRGHWALLCFYPGDFTFV